MKKRGRKISCTERSQHVYDFIVRYKTENDGISPSFREIMENCNISSMSLVKYHINKLADAGLIKPLDIHRTNVRCIQVVDGKWELQSHDKLQQL